MKNVMENVQVYKLLKKIDDGYEATPDEKRMLASIKEIKWNRIHTLPKSMHMLKSLESIDLSGTAVKDIYQLSMLVSLKRLDLSYTEICDIGILKELTGLTDLYLSWNDNLTDISPLSNLTALSRLDLSGGVMGNNISDISPLSDMKKLTSLSLRSTSVIDIESISSLESLTNLDLSYTNVKEIGVLCRLTDLIELELSNTKIDDIRSLENMVSLQNLDLSHTNVREISVLSGLSDLKYLDLRGLTITTIPENLLDLDIDFLSDENPNGPGIYIYGLQVDKVPAEIFSQSRDLIREYIKNIDKVALNECKVIFIGDAEAGKTHSIRRLLKNGAFIKESDNQSTSGIEITVSRTKIDGTDINVNYWDFGGQEIQRSMHRMFLTRRTVYVVFLNARQDPIDERAVFWLENIRSYAPEAPVILIINKIDQNKLPKVNDAGLIETYGNQIKRIVRMSALVDEPSIFMAELQGTITEVIKEMPSVKELVPKSWKALMENVREIPEHYLTAENFKIKCKEKQIEDYQKIHDNLINLFQDIGISFCYYEDRFLSNYFILDPKWLVNAIYAFVLNSDIAAENGKIKRNDLYDLLVEKTLNGKPIKRVYSDMKYEISDVPFILGLTRKFFYLIR